MVVRVSEEGVRVYSHRMLLRDALMVSEGRQVVRECLAVLSPPPEVSSEVLVCAGEALTNAWSYGRGPVGLRVFATEGLYCGQLSYESDPFETRAEMPDPLLLETHGRGIPTMRVLMSQLWYHFDPGRVLVTMVREWS